MYEDVISWVEVLMVCCNKGEGVSMGVSMGPGIRGGGFWHTWPSESNYNYAYVINGTRRAQTIAGATTGLAEKSGSWERQEGIHRLTR